MAILAQLRRDLRSEWERTNPIIHDGEMILVRETESGPYTGYKIGDGVKTFNELEYGNNGSVLQSLGTDGNAAVSQKVTTDHITEYNVSKQFPTGGVSGGNTYTLETAIAMVPIELRTVGMKVMFISSENSQYVTYQYKGPSWVSANFYPLISQELGDSETEVMSQKAITGIYRKYLTDISFSGIVRVDPNRLCNISGDGLFTEYRAHNLYDTAWVYVFSDAGEQFTISGATVIRTNFFNTMYPTPDSYIGNATGLTPTIPQGAVLACITMAKASNPNGYANLRVSQPGMGATKKEMEKTTKDSVWNLTGDLFINKGAWVHLDDGQIRTNESYSYTPYLPITGKEDIIVTGGYNTTGTTGGKITPIAFYDKDRRYISGYSGPNTPRVFKVAKEDIPADAKFIRSCRSDTVTPPEESSIQGYDLSAIASINYSDTFSEDNTIGFSAEGAKLISVAYDDSLTDGFLKKTDGSVGVPSGNDLVVTDFIELNKNFDIIMTGYESGVCSKLCFYDKTKKFISSLDEVSVPTNFRNYRISKNDFPENAYYIRATYRKEYSSSSYIFNTSISYATNEVKKIKKISLFIDESRYIRKITGKNLLLPEEFLHGITYSASTGLIEDADGILSNKLRLRPGVYSVQGIKPYVAVPTTVRICCFDDKDQLLRGDAITLDSNGVGKYTVKAGGDVGNNSYVAYWRLVLQFNSQVLFDESSAQFEYNSEPTEIEPCKFSLIEKPLITPRTVLMTGASSSMPGNGYFETACEMLGFKAYNRAISGESVMQHATKIWRGELYTPEELEEIDILVTSHIHNYDVCFERKEFESEIFAYGFYHASGVFTEDAYWVLDKYIINPNDVNLLVSTVKGYSSTPFVLFFDSSDSFLGYSALFDSESSWTPVIDYPITVPKGTSYVLVKRQNNKSWQTKLRGTTTGILQKTVEDYEAKGYSLSTNAPLTVPLDKSNPDHIIVPYGGGGAAGTLMPSDLYDERYSAGYDYLLKKYAKDCYDLRLNPNSKWYGTKSGKPVIIVCITQWHDGYVRFNESIARLCKKHGAILCDVAGNIGFSYRQTDPENPDSIRWSALHCNNTAIGSGNDTETIPINGVNYTNMGWHPTRDWGCYIQMKRANILAETLKCATY